jgi:two-component system alkaline phosphatase synthesis response regulator PhoP
VQEDPSLVILDINLPGKNGIEICEDLRKTSQIPVIMLTARGGEMDKISGLESGADDYIAKPFSPRELLARVQTILRRMGESSETNTLMRYENISLDQDRAEVFLEKNPVTLTKNEYDLLLTIWLAGGKLVTREYLMKEVMGYDNYVYDRTIDTHIKNLRKKLQNQDMILTVRGK